MKLNHLIIFVFITSVISCKPPKQSTAAAAEPAVQAATSPEVVRSDNVATNEGSSPTGPTVKNPDNSSYRLIVSFISIGEGTDRNGKEMLESFMNDWKTKQKKEVTYETIGWGREGEADFCFPLKELNEQEQKQFVSEIRGKFKGHDLVQFAENEPCRHKR